jgi:hypothetical protein
VDLGQKIVVFHRRWLGIQTTAFCVVGSYVPISLRKELCQYKPTGKQYAQYARRKTECITFLFSSFACLSDMNFRLYRDITCPRCTFSFKKRPCPAFGILDRRIEISGNRMHFEKFSGSPASGKSLIRRAFATYTSPSGEKRGGGRLMRMVLMVDAQNIVSVYTVERGNYQIKAKKISIG